MSALPAGIWALALLGLATGYALRAARMHDEWFGRTGLRWREALHVTLVHSAWVNVLPMRGGELSYPLMLQRRWGVALSDSAASLFWLRAQDALVLAAWAFVLLGPSLGATSVAAVAWRGGLALAALGLLARCAVPLATKLARPIDPPGTQRWRRGLHRLLTAAQRSHPRGWLWSGANWSVKLAVLAMLLHHLADVSLLAAGAGALAGEVAGVLPLQAPAGLGTYEAGVWLGAQLAAPLVHEAGSVLGAAFVVHLTVMVSSVAGAVGSQCFELKPLPMPKPL